MIEGLFREIMTAVDAVNDLQCAIDLDFTGARFQPFHVGLRFLRESDSEQPIQREGGVANPGVAIVPIPSAADRLGQAAGRRRNNRSGRFEGHQFERQRRSVHHFAPAAGIGAFGEPSMPVIDCVFEYLLRFRV